MMTIELNGDRRPVARGLSVAALIAELGLDATKVAVERNLEIVPKSRYAEAVLMPEDRIEIVHFVGGG